MRIVSTGLKLMIIGFVFLVGIVLGTVGSDSVIANTLPGKDQAPAPNYKKNDNGQTYGSGLEATSVETEPDLISAFGVDGTIGYVLSKDLNGEMPKTPEEAIAQQKIRAAEGYSEIPLYDVDGKTVIGVFRVQHGEAVQFVAEEVNTTVNQ